MIKELAQHHKEWIKMVQQMGGCYYSEDIVQEAYIKIHLKKYDLRNGDGINKSYMYIILHSVLIDYLRKKSKVKKKYIEEIKERENQEQVCEIVKLYYNKISDISDEDQRNQEEIDAFKELTKSINKEIDGWHFYDKKVFNMYRRPLDFDLGEKTSIRKIEDRTKISFVTIYHTLKKAKLKIKKTLKNEYEEYKKSV